MTPVEILTWVLLIYYQHDIITSLIEPFFIECRSLFNKITVFLICYSKCTKQDDVPFQFLHPGIIQLLSVLHKGSNECCFPHAALKMLTRTIQIILQIFKIVYTFEISPISFIMMFFFKRWLIQDCGNTCYITRTRAWLMMTECWYGPKHKTGFQHKCRH